MCVCVCVCMRAIAIPPNSEKKKNNDFPNPKKFIQSFKMMMAGQSALSMEELASTGKVEIYTTAINIPLPLMAGLA